MWLFKRTLYTVAAVAKTISLLNLGQPIQAVEAANRGLESHPRQPDLLINKALALFRSGDPEACLK